MANCSFLGCLSLGHNYLNGSIPWPLGLLKTLIPLTSATITLEAIFPSLKNINDFNLSYRSLEGRIPDIFLFFFSFLDTIPDIFQYDGFDRFIGNKDLCGDIKGFAPCPPSSKTMAK